MEIDLSRHYQETRAALHAAEIAAAELRGRLALIEELIAQTQGARTRGTDTPPEGVDHELPTAG